MENVFIVTTSTEGLTPLGTAPQRSFELLASALKPEHAALFAEPVSSDYGDKIDWYTERSGKVSPLSSLPEEERAEVRARLDTLVGEIREIAEGCLADEDDMDRQRLGVSLQNALEIPNEGSIYAQARAEGGYDPILIHWAWVEDRQAVVRGVLSGSDTRAPKKAAVAAGAAAAGASAGAAGAQSAARRKASGGDDALRVSPLFWWLYWLGWLLLALMIAAILLLLIAPCAVRLPFLPNTCLAAGPEASEEARLSLVLRDRIGILERQIEIADRACQPAPGIPDFLPPPREARQAPVVQPPVEDHGDIDGRLERAGAEVGDLTFSLVWDGPDDMDLEVTCPGGVRLFWGTRSGCNGTLDTDSGLGGPALEPVENVFFNQPATGEYQVRVTLPTSRSGGAPQPFRVLVQDGDDSQILEGVLSGREREWTHTYRFGEP